MNYKTQTYNHLRKYKQMKTNNAGILIYNAEGVAN